MLLEYAENATQLFAILSALIICLFRYISSKSKTWLYATIVFLASLLSTYFWASYVVIVGSSPNTSSALAYFGWNLAYAFLFVLVLHVRPKESRRFFHPLMLLPIPINAWQLSLYLPYGGALNSVYQVCITTATAVVSLQGICWYARRRGEGATKPYVAAATLLYVVCEYGMWTTTCFDMPVNGLYYPFSFLFSASLLAITWAVNRTFALKEQVEGAQNDNRFQTVLKSTYLVFVTVCSVGGILLCRWIRDVVADGLGQAYESSVYEILPILLFVVSLFPVAFAVAIIVMVNFREGAHGAKRPHGTESVATDVLTVRVGAHEEDLKVRRTNLLIPVCIIFCLMVCMVTYTSRVIQDVTVANVHEVGEDRISGVAAQLDNYLETTKSLLWVTADTVDHMSRSGSTTQEMQAYVVEETAHQVEEFDENFTGIYGYVQGVFLDGLNWVPPEDYVPTERDWYKAAIEANGEVTIVSPYVDAQTQSVVISICRMLSSGTDVIALDVRMNHIQELAKELKIKDKGYGFIVNEDGLVIAHQDESLKGTYLNQTDDQQALMKRLLEVKTGNFEIEQGGVKETVFVNQLMDQWYVVIVVGNDELLTEVWQQLIVNTIICVVIFSLIAFFYQLGHRNEQNYSRRIEEMRVEEQRQTYEARVLRLEKEAADQANKAKSDFLASMSHEIRTPINAVLGMNEMVLRESTAALNDGPRDTHAARSSFKNIVLYAGNIESAGNSLLAIINDVLDFSKIEAGRMDVVEGDYQLGSLLNDVSSMMYFKAREKGLEFVLDADETIPNGLRGDEVRVRQVITNIVNNAVKYTDSGSVRLEVRARQRPEAADGTHIDLRIAVIDTGIGIKPEDIAKLFTKFQRVDLSRNSTIEGTGLGLAITQNLLELMGGSIEVQSEYGQGSTFTITIPQKVSSFEPLGNLQKRFNKDVAGSRANGGSFAAPDAHILIVDDTRMNLAVAVGLLKETELRIDTASSGAEAIELAGAHAYDVILMDQRMPKMDGTEAMHRIRTQQGGSNGSTPFICLTADAVSGARERYLAEGFNDYLTKPINGVTLEETLLKYLPPEKVKARAKAEVTVAEPDGSDRYAALRAVGMEPEVGLGYCQNDEGLYSSLLYDYVCDAAKKAGSLRELFDACDWKDYAVVVHSLKSTSRMIGVADLADSAEELEHAADRADSVTVANGHAHMLERYDQVVEAIRLVCKDEEASTEDFEDDDSEILEFLPE